MLINLILFTSTAALLLQGGSDLRCYPDVHYTAPVANYTYCNEHGFGLESGGFYDLWAQQSVLTDRLILTYARVNESFSAWIEQPNASSGYYYNDSSAHAIWLEFCNYVKPGIAVWEPDAAKFWAMGYWSGNPVVRMMPIDLSTDQVSYQSLVSGEQVLDVTWNGTTMIAVFLKNGSYNAVAYNRNNLHRVLGSQDNYLELLWGNSVQLLPILNNNYTRLCSLNCTTTTSTIVESTASSVMTPNSSADTQLPSSISTASSLFTSSVTIASTTNLPTGSFVWQVISSFSYTGPIPVPGGALMIPSGTRLSLDVSTFSLHDGDDYILFTYSSIVGQFDGIELLTTSCQQLSAELLYTDSEIKFRVLSQSTLCANAPRLLESIMRFA